MYSNLLHFSCQTTSAQQQGVPQKEETEKGPALQRAGRGARNRQKQVAELQDKGDEEERFDQDQEYLRIARKCQWPRRHWHLWRIRKTDDGVFVRREISQGYIDLPARFDANNIRSEYTRKYEQDKNTATVCFLHINYRLSSYKNMRSFIYMQSINFTPTVNAAASINIHPSAKSFRSNIVNISSVNYRRLMVSPTRRKVFVLVVQLRRTHGDCRTRQRHHVAFVLVGTFSRIRNR